MTEVNFQDAITRGNYTAYGVQYTTNGRDHIIASVTIHPYKRVSGWGWSKVERGEAQTFGYDHPQFSEMVDKGLQVGLHSDVVEVSEETLEDYTRCVLASRITDPMALIRKAIEVVDSRRREREAAAVKRKAQAELDRLGINIQL